MAIVRINPPIYMTEDEMDEKFEGKWVLYYRDIQFEGDVIAIGDDNYDDFSKLTDMIGETTKKEGKVYFARNDTGEDLHVTFNENED